jgi:hypothetical protein
MNFDGEVKFQRILGKRVIKTETCWWLELLEKNVYLSWPHDILDDIKLREVVALSILHPLSMFVLTTKNKKLLGIEHKSHFWYASKPYNLLSLDKKARNQTRRGLENCKVAKIGWDLLIKEGMRINKSSLSRQNRKSFANPIFTSENFWVYDCKCCEKFDDIEAWGAFVDDNLAAYCTIQTYDDKGARIRSAMSDTYYLNFYPNNALIFSVTENMLSRPNIEFVAYGGESSDLALEHFKKNMGFYKREVYRYLFFSPGYLIWRLAHSTRARSNIVHYLWKKVRLF